MIGDDDDLRKELDDLLMSHLGPGANKVFEQHVLNPSNAGYLDNPNGMASVTGLCEDTIRIQIRVKDDRILDIRFMTNGCLATVACSSMATDMAKGKIIQEAYNITGKMIDATLGGLPKEHAHCAALAANALREAINDYLHTKRESWKRIYRTPRQW
jgi:NifU-like protein involved in Fe-S cluster formation